MTWSSHIRTILPAVVVAVVVVVVVIISVDLEGQALLPLPGFSLLQGVGILLVGGDVCRVCVCTVCGVWYAVCDVRCVVYDVCSRWRSRCHSRSSIVVNSKCIVVN